MFNNISIRKENTADRRSFTISNVDGNANIAVGQGAFIIIKW